MWLSVVVTACLVAVALAVPVSQGPYLVRRPQNSVSLHTEARQRNLNSGRQQFVVALDDDSHSREDSLLSLQGVGNFAATASQTPVAPSVRTQVAPQSFNLDGGATFNVELDDQSRESVELTLGSFAAPAQCPAGQLRHGSRCVVPRINRNIFVFGKDDSPEQKSIDSVELPLPQLDYNIIFVRSRAEKSRKPIVVPPPQKKTVVYVLEDEITDKDLIEVPSYPDADPEVYYVKVKPGENPQLPGGLDLETAYSQAIRPSDSLENSFESSIELNIGAGGFGGSAQGVATFNSGDDGFSAGGDLSFSSGGDASFSSGGDAGFSSGGDAGFSSGGDAGFSSNGGVGVPLPDFRETTGSDQGFNAGFDSGSSFGGDAGFDTGSTSFNDGNAGFDSGFNGGSSSVGVPLPDFRNNDFSSKSGNAGFSSNSGNAGFSSNGGNAGFSSNNRNARFDTDLSLDAGDSQTFSGTAQFNAETSFGNGQGGFNSNIDFAAKGLSVEIDDGRIKVEASSDEVVQPALRYQLPRNG